MEKLPTVHTACTNEEQTIQALPDIIRPPIDHFPCPKLPFLAQTDSYPTLPYPAQGTKPLRGCTSQRHCGNVAPHFFGVRVTFYRSQTSLPYPTLPYPTLPLPYPTLPYPYPTLPRNKAAPRLHLPATLWERCASFFWGQGYVLSFSDIPTLPYPTLPYPTLPYPYPTPTLPLPLPYPTPTLPLPLPYPYPNPALTLPYSMFVCEKP